MADELQSHNDEPHAPGESHEREASPTVANVSEVETAERIETDTKIPAVDNDPGEKQPPDGSKDQDDTTLQSLTQAHVELAANISDFITKVEGIVPVHLLDGMYDLESDALRLLAKKKPRAERYVSLLYGAAKAERMCCVFGCTVVEPIGSRTILERWY